jgi:hypothetical protein
LLIYQGVIVFKIPRFFILLEFMFKYQV